MHFVFLKVSYKFVQLTLFVELRRCVPIKAPVYKDISIFSCALCFVVTVYYTIVPLTLFVELKRFVPIKAPDCKYISIFNCGLSFVVKVSYSF